MDLFCKIPPFSPMKSVLRPAESSKRPLPVLAGEFLHQFHQDVHERHYTDMPSLGIYLIEEGFVGPSGVALNLDRQFYYSPDLFGHDFMRHAIEKGVEGKNPNNGYYRAASSLSEVALVEDRRPIVVVNKPGYQVYGHWLIDLLPSLWMFIVSKDKHGIDPRNALYLLPSSVPAWGMDIFTLLFGIDEKNVSYYDDAKTVVRARNLLVISRLHFRDCMSPLLNDFYMQVVSSIASLRSPAYPKRFYISRRGVKSYMAREVNNFERLEEIAKERGIVVVDPAKMPWPDQIRMFADAELVVGPFGSGLHNTVFSASSTITFCLSSSRMNWLQSGISALRGQKSHILWLHLRELRAIS